MCLVAAIVALAGQQAVAQSSQGGWEYTVAPFLIGAAMDGTVAVKGQDVDLDVPFSDIMANLHFAGMGYFAMKNDQWYLSGQLVYMNLKQSQDVANGTAEVTVEETIADVAGGYRVSEQATLLVGARLVDLRADLGFDGPQAGRNGKASKTWVDPFVGVAFLAPLSERWWLDLHGDIGGFGVGSDLTWQAWADVGYRASDLVTVFLGFRAFDVDYEDGSGTSLFRYDVLTSGPQFGVAFRF
jgi:hypothetical protein